MAPKTFAESETIPELQVKESPNNYKLQIVWRNVILMSYLHTAAIYGLYLLISSAKWETAIFAYCLYIFSGLGITAGAHRLWSHRTYKAKWPLRILLAIMQTMAFENDIYEWSRDHRVHHKYSETDADPHNAKRGFFFSHIGWLLCKKHPDVIIKGKSVDCSDIMADPIVRFQRKYYLPLVTLICFIIPSYIPLWLWSEKLWNSFFVCGLLRYAWTLNMTWLVNSAAHMWGNRPYDKTINPRENTGVTVGTMGEGYHNYHHTFPFDYRTSEYSASINFTSTFIEFFAKIGLAYDLKTVTPQTISKRKERTGELSKVN